MKNKPTSPRRVLVCGGRDYADEGRVFSALDALHTEETATTLLPIGVLIQGGAGKQILLDGRKRWVGADALAKAWAWSRKIHCDTYWPDWEGFRRGGNVRGAGPSRNTLMLHLGKPTVLLAFPGGGGTANMVGKARAAGVIVLEA